MMDNAAASQVISKASRLVLIWSPWWSSPLGKSTFLYKEDTLDGIMGLSDYVLIVSKKFLYTHNIMDIAIRLEFALQQSSREMDIRTHGMKQKYPHSSPSLIALSQSLEINNDMKKKFQYFDQSTWDYFVHRDIDTSYIRSFHAENPPALPEGAWTADKLGLPDDLRAESYMDLLVQMSDQREQDWLNRQEEGEDNTEESFPNKNEDDNTDEENKSGSQQNEQEQLDYSGQDTNERDTLHSGVNENIESMDDFSQYDEKLEEDPDIGKHEYHLDKDHSDEHYDMSTSDDEYTSKEKGEDDAYDPSFSGGEDAAENDDTYPLNHSDNTSEWTPAMGSESEASSLGDRDPDSIVEEYLSSYNYEDVEDTQDNVYDDEIVNGLQPSFSDLSDENNEEQNKEKQQNNGVLEESPDDKFIPLDEEIRRQSNDNGSMELQFPNRPENDEIVGLNEDEKKQVQKEMAQDIKDSEGLFSLPGKSGSPVTDHFDAWSKKRLKKPKSNWKKIFPRLMQPILSKGRMEGKADMSYAKMNPNQKHGPNEPILPGWTAYPPEVTVLIDASPSMLGEKDVTMREFIGVIKMLFVKYAQPITVILADSGIKWMAQSMSPYGSIMKHASKTYHGSSYSFGDTVETLLKKRVKHKGRTYQKPDILVIFTDCLFYWPLMDKKTLPKNYPKVMIVSTKPYDDVQSILPPWVKDKKNFVYAGDEEK